MDTLGISPILKHLPPCLMRVRHQTIFVSQIKGLCPKGPNVVLIHGIAASAATWLLLVRCLVPYCRRIIIPDLPGHGLSPAPNPPFDCISAYECVRDVLLRTLDPESNNVLIGNSLGGAFALRFCIDCKDLARQCILISPAGAPFPTSARDVIAPFLPDSVENARSIVRRVFVGQSKTRERILAPLIQWMTNSDGFRSMMQSIIDIDTNPNSSVGKFLFSPDLLQNFDITGALIWGNQDKILPVQMRDYFDLYLPKDFKRLFVPEFGHCPQFDEPKKLAHYLLEMMCC